jgi:membrane-anchored protein YejM (alkaline phosphatase superfamily)
MKIIITILFSLVGISLLVTIFKVKYSRAIYQHRKWARFTFFLMLLSVVVVEIYVHLNDGHLGSKTMFLIHLPCAGLFLLGMAWQLWQTGYKKPRVHKIVGYIVCILYIATFVTGMILLWKNQEPIKTPAHTRAGFLLPAPCYTFFT